MKEDETIIVNSLSEYIANVSKIRNQWDEYNPNTYRYYYRGQFSNEWKLTPYLFRDHSNRGTVKLVEYNLLQQASSYCWKWIKDFKTYTEKLVFFQHFGLPTRLLDVTTNPLAALFFACYQENQSDEDKEKDGIVYIGNSQPMDINLIEFISELIFTNQFSNLKENYIEELFYKHLEYRIPFEEICEQFLMQSHFFYAPYNNDRINAQSGAFIMSPLYDFRGGNNNPIARSDIDFNSNRYKNANDPFLNKKIIIPQDKKNIIYKELAICGIHEASLFPDVEHMLKYVRRDPQSFDVLKWKFTNR